MPGARRNTVDATRFIARDARARVASVFNILNARDIPADAPPCTAFFYADDEIVSEAGTCLCVPDGEWFIDPVTDDERLFVATIDHRYVHDVSQFAVPSATRRVPI